jgi:hypothetical protein
MTTSANATAIDRLLAGIEAAAIPDSVFSDDAVLDATVPNWRFSVHGGTAVRKQLAGWYADPGHYQALERSPLPDGELVEFTLSWTEQGIQHTCHQAHILKLQDGRISGDTVFCGGRWPADLVAEMRQTQEASA